MLSTKEFELRKLLVPSTVIMPPFGTWLRICMEPGAPFNAMMLLRSCIVASLRMAFVEFPTSVTFWSRAVA